MAGFTQSRTETAWEAPCEVEFLLECLPTPCHEMHGDAACLAFLGKGQEVHTADVPLPVSGLLIVCALAFLIVLRNA